jgi:hypothetical protein
MLTERRTHDYTRLGTAFDIMTSQIRTDYPVSFNQGISGFFATDRPQHANGLDLHVILGCGQFPGRSLAFPRALNDRGNVAKIAEKSFRERYLVKRDSGVGTSSYRGVV